MTGDRQALQAEERSGSVGDMRRSVAEGPQPSAHMRTSTSLRLERLPSGFLERIPEHAAAALEAPLTAQDLLPGAHSSNSRLG